MLGTLNTRYIFLCLGLLITSALPFPFKVNLFSEAQAKMMGQISDNQRYIRSNIRQWKKDHTLLGRTQGYYKTLPPFNLCGLLQGIEHFGPTGISLGQYEALQVKELRERWDAVQLISRRTYIPTTRSVEVKYLRSSQTLSTLMEITESLLS